MERGGVEGGEGKRVGWMGEGEEGSCSVGEESGKNTTGWMGETGEGDTCFVGEEGWDAGFLVGEEKEACLVGEEGVRGKGRVDSVGDDGEGQEMGVEGVGGQDGEVGSMDKQGAAGREAGNISISGGEEIGKEAMGGVSAEGEGEN